MAPRSFLPLGTVNSGYGVAKDKLVIPMVERRSNI